MKPFRQDPTDLPASQDELVRRAVAGDPEAFGDLYDRMVDRIYRFVYFRTQDPADAEDLTSKVFLKAWDALPRYRRSRAPFSAWLYRIARHVVIDHHRASRAMADLDAQANNLQDPGQAPEPEAERGLEAQALHRALQTLTGEQREVLILKFVDELPTSQIASILGKRPGAIRALQMRGLDALAEALGETRGR